jgi:hypothetical protein
MFGHGCFLCGIISNMEGNRPRSHPFPDTAATSASAWQKDVPAARVGVAVALGQMQLQISCNKSKYPPSYGTWTHERPVYPRIPLQRL